MCEELQQRQSYPLLALRGVELQVEVLRDGHEVGELLGVGAELVQQRRQRGDEVRRQLRAVVAHHLPHTRILCMSYVA